MRMTGTSGWMERNLTRTLRLAAVAFGVGLVMAAGPVRAGDDEDDKTFEEKVIEGIMAGIGGTNMENRGIDYRERSPLVLPPNSQLTVLPSPEDVANSKKAANWPDYPDLKRVKLRREQERKRKPQEPGVDDKPLSPSKMMEGAATAGGPTTPRGG